MQETIGFVGLGQMGLPMAANLLKAGFALRIWNRTPERAEPLVASGAKLVSNIEELAEPGGILVSSLPDDAVLQETIGSNHKLLERLGKGGVHISTSTIAPATSKSMAEQHQKFGVAYVAATVLGRPDVAAAAKLSIFVSGPQDVRKRAQPILKALGQKIFEVGDDPGAANVAKLACNFFLASAMEAMAEALALAEKNGVKRMAMADFFAQTLLAGTSMANYVKQIGEHRYEPALFKLKLGLKDVRLANELADASAVPMPLASLVHDHLLSAVAKGRGDFDWSAIATIATEAAGLSVGS